jgi:hypothetical protein
MKEIELLQNKIVLVDDEDYERLKNFKWYYNNHNSSGIGYAFRFVKISPTQRKFLSMHRQILGLPPGSIPMVDHKDGNGLNNCKSNLRICTNQQNQFNSKLRSDNTSGFKGVYYSFKEKKWRSTIKIGKKRMCLGAFSNKIDAAKAYNQAAIEHIGEFAKINNV